MDALTSSPLTETHSSPHLDQQSPEVSPWWRVDDAARYLRLCTRTVRREAAAGRLRHARIGGRKALRFRRDWCDQFVEKYSTPIEAAK